jgi:chromate reductase
MKILVIPGSLRVNSFNKALARHIVEIAPKEVEMEILELNDIPMFNADLEESLPVPIVYLLDQVSKSDAIIISTPEYNNLLPAPVKNVIHWLSRDYSKGLIKDKPLGIMGVSDGNFGTVRAQNELLLIGSIIGMKTNASYRLPVPNALDVFDDEGMIIDEKLLQRAQKFLDNFIKGITN